MFYRGPALRQFFQSTQRLVEGSPGVSECRSRGRLPSGLPEIVHCLLLQVALDGMIGEPLDLLGQPVGVKVFDGSYDTSVDLPATFVEHPAIGDVVSERVLERILQVRKELRRIEEFGSLQIVEQTAKLVLGQPANCVQEHEWNVVSDDCRLLQQVLSGSSQRVDSRCKNRLHCGRDLCAGEWPCKAVAATCTLEDSSINQPSHDLFDEERIPVGAFHQESFQGEQA